VVDFIQPTAKACYANREPGAGVGTLAVRMLAAIGQPLKPGQAVVELGSGKCHFARYAASVCGCSIYAVDIAPSTINRLVELAVEGNRILPLHLDVSVNPLPLATDSIDAAVCTETIEHLSNPYFAVAEVKRVLKDGAPFAVTFPMPEALIGYGPGRHAYVYPGFLLGHSFELFMRQLFFKQVEHIVFAERIACYVFSNYKGPAVRDVFDVVASDVDGSEVYGCLDG